MSAYTTGHADGTGEARVDDIKTCWTLGKHVYFQHPLRPPPLPPPPQKKILYISPFIFATVNADTHKTPELVCRRYVDVL